MNTLLRQIVFLSAMVTALLCSAVAEVDDRDWEQAVSSQSAQGEEAAYTSGTHALNDSRWSDAVTAFEQVGDAHGKRGDAALYWKAYALTKLGKSDLANATCVQLHTQFEASRWNRDCAALHGVQGPGAGAAGVRDENAELKMLALNSLMHRDPAQAIPILREILTGDQPDSVKRHALFVLAQSHSAEADGLMHDLVLGKLGLELQRQGIQACGVYQGRRAGEVLAEAYRTSVDLKVKRAVISALFVAGDDGPLVGLARSEKDLELKRTIVSQLALMNGKAASEYMFELLK